MDKIEVLDDGFIKFVDVMGSDDSIVQAARVSYGDGTKTPSDDRTLIRYLMRHRHTTPFEMCEMKFHVRVPMDCWRQWIRHRTANVNEYSTRYSTAIDSQQKTTKWRAQATTNKQGSGDGELHWPEGWSTSYPSSQEEMEIVLSQNEEQLLKYSSEIYQQRIDFGVAREQARKDLPLSTYTEAYWKCDLHNIFHFLGLRMDSHAQLEIREYANAMYELVKQRFPVACEAFEDYRLNGMFLTGPEIQALSSGDTSHLSKGELRDFEGKKTKLGVV